MVRIAPFGRLPWPLRWLTRLLCSVLVLLLVVTGILVFTVRRSFPQLDGEIRVPGLAGRVTVYRDRYGVPQIYADTAADLFRAQGYVHAQDRFWEMDFRRKTTAGRLSELFGESTLDVDKVVRTLGWRRTAGQELAMLKPATREALDAYSAGVNAWLGEHRGAWDQSLEFAVLKLTNRAYTPEPWTPTDSLAWLKAMAWDLRSNMDTELQRAIVAAHVPIERVKELFPGYPYDRHRPIVTSGAGDRSPIVVGASAGSTRFGPATAGALEGAERAVAALPALLGTDGGDVSGIGSNSWVVSGRLTDTGKPLLANDPHLGPRIPSIWYQAGLHCRTPDVACPYDVVGFTFSGVPGVVIGHNARIAWGFTNLGPDVTDLYLEQVKGDSYRYKGEWRPLEVRRERIEVAGGKPVELAIRSTQHGPIISGVLPDAKRALPGAAAGITAQAAAGQGTAGQGTDRQGVDGTDVDDLVTVEPGARLAVALRWTALEPGRTADAIPMLDTAVNWAEFRAAAAAFEVPAQNMIYADVDGNIGYQAPGRIPLRAKGDGRWPVPGWTGDYEWIGFIPFDRLPRAYDPPQGFIVTANNAAAPEGNGPFLTFDWSYGYRSQRIADRIEQAAGKGAITIATMADIQRDTYNGLAPALVPYLMRVKDAPAARDLLRGWDFTQGADSAPAAYFNAVWRHLLAAIFDDELPEPARSTGSDRWFEIIQALLDRPDDAWWDDVRTKDRRETRDEVLSTAMDGAADELTKRLGGDPASWRWGDLHTLELTNETFGTSGIGPIESLFNRGPLTLAGSRDAVDATGWDARVGYEVDWVPSMRMIVDLADLDRSRWVNLTGASGHAFAANYTDQAELWADGGTTPMRQTLQAVRKDAADTLTLTP
ncbi:MAG TPA: penicillin acylase family protein [Thermopolyspora sp.]